MANHNRVWSLSCLVWCTLLLSIRTATALPGNFSAIVNKEQPRLVFSLRTTKTFSRSVRARSLLPSTSLDVRGSAQQDGYFYANVAVGTPPQPFSVILDTGSSVMYISCSDCGDNCGQHMDPGYQKAASSTFLNIGCGDAKCRTNQCGTGNHCTYSRNYAEGSSANGHYYQDNMNLPGFGGVPVSFGCSTRETGMLHTQDADGVLGLGKGREGIIRQLHEQGLIDHSFALCLSWYPDGSGGGVLILGKPAPSTLLTDLKYTKFLPNSRNSYYVVDMNNMKLGDASLGIEHYVYKTGYGTVVDTGTTFTYLVQPAFAAFVRVLRAAVTLPEVEGPDPRYPDDICFGSAGPSTTLAAHFPALNIHFADGKKLTVPPENYLWIHTKRAGAYCLGVFGNQMSGSLLGAITFRNTMMVYDESDEAMPRFGFQPNVDCEAIQGENLNAEQHHPAASPSPAAAPPPPSPPPLTPPSPPPLAPPSPPPLAPPSPPPLTPPSPPPLTPPFPPLLTPPAPDTISGSDADSSPPASSTPPSNANTDSPPAPPDTGAPPADADSPAPPNTNATDSAAPLADDTPSGSWASGAHMDSDSDIIPEVPYMGPYTHKATYEMLNAPPSPPPDEGLMPDTQDMIDKVAGLVRGQNKLALIQLRVRLFLSVADFNSLGEDVFRSAVAEGVRVAISQVVVTRKRQLQGTAVLNLEIRQWPHDTQIEDESGLEAGGGALTRATVKRIVGDLQTGPAATPQFHWVLEWLTYELPDGTLLGPDGEVWTGPRNGECATGEEEECAEAVSKAGKSHLLLGLVVLVVAGCLVAVAFKRRSGGRASRYETMEDDEGALEDGVGDSQL